MRVAILDRYLAREAGQSWVAVTLVLLLVMLSNRFAYYLRYAASGELPANVLGWLVGLSTVRYLVYLIPASFLLAIMLSLGRLYRDNEMAAMGACGVGLKRLYRPFLAMAVVLAIVTGVLSLVSGPWAARKAEMVYERAKQEVKFTLFAPGGFRPLPDDRGVFYAEGLGENGTSLRNIFIRARDPQRPTVITAERGIQRIDADSGQRTFVLIDGYRVEGRPGQGAFRVMRFGEHGVRVGMPGLQYTSSDRSEMSTAALLGSSDPRALAELQWRLSAPLSVLVLALLGVPLAHVQPRQGRYAKLLLGILLYVIYSNLLGLAQSWTGAGLIPPALGLWWVHVLFVILGLWLLLRRQGRAPLRRLRRRRSGAAT